MSSGIKNGNCCNWLGLIAKVVTKYLEKSLAMRKDHMQQQRKNVRSTRIITPEQNANDRNRRMLLCCTTLGNDRMNIFWSNEMLPGYIK